jgi:hypothetical protein
MKQLKLALNKHSWGIGFFASLVLVFIYLVIRNNGLYPFVFADELLYSSFSRLLPLKDATIPSYLYLWIYRSTNLCGDGFLGCARILNALFFVAAAPFIFLSARTVSSRTVATVIALACVLSPINSYTAYFMPESLYFFGFSVLTWFTLARKDMQWASYGIVTGCILGLMALVKVHALFLLPAQCVFIVFVSWANNRHGTWIQKSLATVCIAITAMFATKFALSYAFAGKDGLHILGPLYGPAAQNSINAGAVLLKILPAALNSMKGHLMALVLLFALPFAAIIHHALSASAKSDVDKTVATIHVYAILMLAAPLMMTVAYTASVADIEGLRLHMRYYDFSFPLLFMVAASGIGAQKQETSRAFNWAIAVPLAAALVYSALHLATAFKLIYIDGPEIASLALNLQTFKAVIGLELVILAVWALNRGVAACLFVFLFLPVCVINSSIGTGAHLKQMAAPGSFDNAGIFAHRYLSVADRNDLSIAGTELSQLMRAKFHVDDPAVVFTELAQDAPLDSTQVPFNKKWLLVVGDHALPPDIKPEVATPEYALIRIQPGYRRIELEKLSAPLPNGMLIGVDGLSGVEAWGRWSMANRVTLHFNSALPKSLALTINARAFGPNVGQNFTLRVGASQRTFRLPAWDQDVYIRLQTNGTEKTMMIDVPHPVSPQELGLGDDGRRLGLGLISVEIGSADER